MLVFQAEYKYKKGLPLWIQQMKALLTKRIIIFARRYFLAAFLLIFAALIHGISIALIPSQTYLLETITGTYKSTGKYLLDINKYNPQSVPYSIVGAPNFTKPLEEIINLRYNQSSSRPNLLRLDENITIDAFVLNKRKENLRNLYQDFYLGFTFDLTSINQIKASAFFSTLAYHSSATVVNEVTNIVLNYLLKPQNKTASIRTINAPLSINTTRSRQVNFLNYLACFDVLPLSILNLLTSIVIGLVISLMVIHLTKEKSNGFKTLQMLSGTNIGNYWLANYLFDLALCIINASLLIVMIKIVNLAKKDETSELFVIGKEENIGFVVLLFYLSAISWPTIAAIWSHLFKCEVTSFVIMTLILGTAAFLDVVFAFLQFFINLNIDTDDDRDTKTSDIFYALRIILLILFPNVTIKRGLFDLKTRKNNYCIEIINHILKSKLIKFIFAF